MSLWVYLETPTCEHCHQGGHELFSANITDNLGKMAQAAGIHLAVWSPDECGITTAEQLIPILSKGLYLLKSDPERFNQFSAANGWGTYEQFVPWLERYLTACLENPKAILRTST